jgi:hypothetical protein
MAAMVLRRLLRGWEQRMLRETRGQSVALAAFSLLRTHIEVVSAALVWIGGTSTGERARMLEEIVGRIAERIHSFD